MDFAETIRGIFGGQSSQPPPAGEDYASDLRPMVEPTGSRRPKLSLSTPKPTEHDPVLGEELHKILADSAREAAALRTRESVRPTGGREEGGATTLIEKLPGALISAPIRGIARGAEDMRRVKEGELDPMSQEGVVAGMGAAMNVLGQSPFSGRSTLGAGGGKLVQPTKSAATTGGVEDMIKAYHGSPHDFDRFDLSKIGTGEGAQAYGQGLYFAENEGVAKGYRDALATRTGISIGGKNVPMPESGPERKAWVMIANDRDIDRSLGRVAKDDPAKDVLEKWKQQGVEFPTGKTYQVGIRANPEHFLDWDKPLSEQHPKVQEAFGKIVDRNLAEEPGWAKLTGQEALNAAAQRGGKRGAGEQMLREAGIPGIKYADARSRGNPDAIGKQLDEVRNAIAMVEKQTGNPSQAERLGNLRRDEAQLAKDHAYAKNPTRNYVVFDDKLIDILKKYGIAGIGALPAMNAFHYQDKQ